MESLDTTCKYINNMIVNPKEKMIEYVYEKRIVCSVRMHHPFGVNASSVHPERIIRLGHTHHSFGIDVSSVFPQIYFSISLSSNLLMLCTFSGRMGGRFFS